MSTSAIPTFRANLILRGQIETLTGLHIGGSREKMQIGGVDLVVVRSARDSMPYIPGSTLKGKMRHLLEYATGGVALPVDNKLGNVSYANDIVRLFGVGAGVTELVYDDKALAKEKQGADAETTKYLNDLEKNVRGAGLPRLIFRDAYLSEAAEEEDLVEIKAENNIDRLTAAANPRFQERVAERTRFDFEIVYTAYDEAETDIQQDINRLFAGLRLLENSFIGKGGSRGSGQIRFHVAPPLWITKAHYLGEDTTATRDVFERYDQTTGTLQLDRLPHTPTTYYPTAG